MNPLITVVVTAYNRSGTINRTLQSIINQTYKNLEIIVVDDGSTDNTVELVEKIEDKRIKLIRHDKNKGVIGAKNTGLDNINGEWFVFVDSDDEIIPEAVETLIRVPLEFDNEVTAIDSGVFETVSNKLSERFLSTDMYVNEEEIIRESKGDVWGMTKTSLLGNDRLNNNLPGWEDTLWYKINARAKRYYLNKQLYIYHTEGVDRVSKKRHDVSAQAKTYKALLDEEFYLNRVKKYNKKRYIKYCLRAIINFRITREGTYAQIWLNMLKEVNFMLYILVILVRFLPKNILKIIVTRV